MAKDEFITLRMDTELLNLVRELQKKYDISQSEVMRQLLAKGVSSCAENDIGFASLSEALRRKMKFDDADIKIKLAYRDTLFFSNAKKKLNNLKSDGYVEESELRDLALKFYEKSLYCYNDIQAYTFKMWLLNGNILRLSDFG